MPVFAYKASSPDAASISGVVVADTPRQARDALRAKGLTVREVTARDAPPERTDSTAPAPASRGSRPGRHAADLAAFARELSTLLGAGVPLLEAVDILALQRTGRRSRRAGGRGSRFGAALLVLRDRLSAGVGLAAAMAEQPGVFDELCISLTDVGESAGTLESALDRLADFKERSLAFKNRIVAVLTYPAFVLATALVTSLVLMTVVVPGLLGALAEAGKPLPWPTLVVKAISDFVLHHGWLLLAAIVLIAVLLQLSSRTRRGRYFWHGLQLRFPVVGDLARKQAIARLCVVLSTLLKSGVVFIRALQIAQRATPNLVLRDALHRCEAAVLAGRDISDALDETGAFPALVVRVIGVGQQSGRLEEMLERLAADYDLQVTRATQRLTSILEPVLILVLVLIVGFIAFATVMPLLEAADVS